MVKFTSTVVAASLFAGSALAAPSFSRSDNVAITAREIEALFGREMVEFASRSPNHWKEVEHAAHAVHKITNAASAVNDNSRREYLVARQDTGGDSTAAPAEPVAEAPVSHPHMHPHVHNHMHSHDHPHNHAHAHSHNRREYFEFEARQDTGAGDDPAATSAGPVAETPVSHPHMHNHMHNHMHSHDHPHNHAHAHSHNRREYYEFEARAPQDDGAAPAAAPAAPVHHAHPAHHDPQAAHNWAKLMENIRAHSHQHGGAGPHTHQHMHHPSAPAPVVASRSLDDYYESLIARQDTGAGDATAAEPVAQAPVPHIHPHNHNHGHGHMHSGMPHNHAHAHFHSSPSRRSVDFDELYARYADFDDLD